MSLPVLEQDGRATLAVAEAQSALAAGDTPHARKMYGAAARLLANKIATPRQSDKHLFRFLAASQYYHGGLYRKALHLCRRVEQRLLPDEVRHLFPKFFHDVKSRAAPSYEKRVREELLNLLTRQENSRILEKLQEHPYVLQPGILALLRAHACENLGNFPAAAIF